MKSILALVGLSALMGAGCATSGPAVPPSVTPPTSVPSSVTPQTSAAFNVATTVSIGERIFFQDGMKLTLTAINDSRCPSGVQCIWAGELSPVFTFVDADQSSQEVVLGTTRALSVTVKNYVISLTSATTEEATITVSKK